MAKARVAVSVIEEVLRLHHECGRSQREIARSCGLSAGAVNKLLRLAGQPARGGADSWRRSTSPLCTRS